MPKNKNAFDLKVRTTDYALRIIRLFQSLPKGELPLIIGRQILRSGTSVGAHYRESRRARSAAEFVSKLSGALQELEETAYWLELLEKSKVFATARLSNLKRETEELLAILACSVKTAGKKKKKKSR